MPQVIPHRRLAPEVASCVAISSAVRRRGIHCRLGRALLFLQFCLLVHPALAYGSKGGTNDFLKAYPMIMKFCLFWWCVLVFVIMSVYIIDHFLFQYRGPANVKVDLEHTISGVADREAYWAQLVDPSMWMPTHPVLQSADVRMVQQPDKSALPKSTEKANGEGKADGDGEGKADNAAGAGKDASTSAAAGAEEKNDGEPTKTMWPVELGPMTEGFGLSLRHKAGDPRAGGFFCTRICTTVDTPAEGPWRLIMRTVDVGGGYPFLPDTEESVVEVWPVSDDGSIKCNITISASVASRIFRWWTGLQKQSELGALAMLNGIGDEVGSAKKKD